MLELLFTGSMTATLLVGTVVGVLVYWLIQKRKYNFPPGPRGLPFVGSMFQIDFNKLDEEAFTISRKYGPVITLKLGSQKIIFVNKIGPALEVLVKKSTDFADRTSYPSHDLFTFGGKDIVLGKYSPTWKIHRKIASSALRHYMQGDNLQRRINDAVGTLFEELDKETGEFDPADYINFAIMNILTGLCFGGKYAFGDEELRYALVKNDRVLELFGTQILEDFIPGLKYVYKTKPFKQMEQVTEDMIENFFRRKYKEAERTFDRDHIRHFCDNLILARLEAEEEEGSEAMESLTEDHVVQTLSDIFTAGIDTSRFTLNFAINHMIAFPDIQEKVQEEIDRVVGKDRLPNAADRPNLGYTEAVLHETMRLSTIVPLGLMHKTTCDTEVAGYRIPQGTQVNINHWALHNDPEAWEEVDRFIPERYLDENGKLGPKPTNWLPFSAGKRVCLGEFVAKPELHLVFACLLQRYKWKMVSGKCADLTPGGSIFGRQCKPYKAIVERRI